MRSLTFTSGHRRTPSGGWQVCKMPSEALDVFPGVAVLRPKRGEELRHFVYKSHRIIYRIESHMVRVLYVRHGARRPVGDPASDEDA